MRKYVLMAISVLVLAGSFFGAKKLIELNSKGKPQFNKLVKTVYSSTASNSEIPVLLSSSGNLVAKERIVLFSEVQGVLRPMPKLFKAGTHYKNNETILSLNSEEFNANLMAQKSNLFNVLTAVMPDIQLDFPDSYTKWEHYLKAFDLTKPIPDLPQTGSDKEKFFISGRGIYTSYYQVKNLEVKLNKFSHKAPFSGILTEALVTEGTLVRVGQKLGEYINPGIFELEVNINEAFAYLLKTGTSVSVHNLSNTKRWTGKVARINGKVNPETQSIKVYLDVKGEGLHEGMYLTAELQTRQIKNALKVSRKLLVDNSKLFIIKDSVLQLISINPVHFNNETVIVKGVPDGAKLMSKPLPGAFDGMLVKVENE